MAWHAKETLRGLYDQPAEGAPGYLDELVESLLEPAMSPELRQLGRTLRTWRHEICAWHQAQVSNGPTEATNNLIKVIKRIGFGFRRYRTTGSESCSTPADPTGTYSPRSTRSLHPEIRRARILLVLHNGTGQPTARSAASRKSGSTLATWANSVRACGTSPDRS